MEKYYFYVITNNGIMVKDLFEAQRLCVYCHGEFPFLESIPTAYGDCCLKCFKDFCSKGYTAGLGIIIN